MDLELLSRSGGLFTSSGSIMNHWHKLKELEAKQDRRNERQCNGKPLPEVEKLEMENPDLNPPTKLCIHWPAPHEDTGGVCHAGSEIGNTPCTDIYSIDCEWAKEQKERDQLWNPKD